MECPRNSPGLELCPGIEAVCSRYGVDLAGLAVRGSRAPARAALVPGEAPYRVHPGRARADPGPLPARERPRSVVAIRRAAPLRTRAGVRRDLMALELALKDRGEDPK